MQKQRLLSDRQQFQREQMKLLELRSPTTLTPQTPLPLTPSARQFVVPTTKLAPPPTAIDATKDTPSVAASEGGMAKETSGAAADIQGVPNADNPVQRTELKDGNATVGIDASNVLTAAESGGGAELLPPVDDHMTNTTTNTTGADDLFPIDFPNSDHQSPVTEDHMIPEGNEVAAIQQSMEFEAPSTGSHDPTAFDDFNNMGQFDQSEVLPETSQSDQLDKLAEQLDQLPQQPVPLDDNRQTDDIDVQQLEELSTDTS